MSPTWEVGGRPLDQLQRENDFLGLTWGPRPSTCALHGGEAGVDLFFVWVEMLTLKGVGHGGLGLFEISHH